MLTSGHGLGPWDVLALAAWFGLAAGWLEVGTRVLCKSLIGVNRLYLMTRHFVWLVPVSNLLLFLIGGWYWRLPPSYGPAWQDGSVRESSARRPS